MKNWHILVIEDEPDGQEVFSRILSYFAVKTDTVDTAEDALSLLKQNQYTAVISDLALPGMDGIELINLLRNDPKTAHLPCVATTAYHSSLVKQQALEAGFDAYFPKPLDDTTFIRELERIIARP